MPAILWALVILLLCSFPGKSIPKISWLELLSFDKFVHASIFFILQILLTRGFVTQNYNTYLLNKGKTISLMFCVLYGGALEIMQSTLFLDRSGDWNDFIANSFGAIMAFIFYTKISKIKLTSFFFK